MKTENLLNHQPKHYTSFSGIKYKRSNTNANLLVSNLESNVNDEIKINNRNTATAGINPSGRLSFKGRIPTPVAKTIGEKLAVNKGFNKLLDVLSYNTLVAESLIALFLTAVARPASIYAIPTKDPVEKKKNNYQVAHSVATGLLGLATTFIVSEPISRAVKKVAKNPQDYTQNEATRNIIKKNKTIFEETAKRLHQPIFLPLRAAATIAIVPPILRFFGLSKNGKSVPKADKAKIDYSFMNFKGNESKSFKGFDKIAVASAKNTPSFKGAEILAKEIIKNGTIKEKIANTAKVIDDKVTEKIAKKVIVKVADSKPMHKLLNWFERLGKGPNLDKEDSKIWLKHLIAAESLWLSGFYMERTARSKTIEKDQKLPMILNQGITAVLCTIGAYLLDGAIKKKLENYKRTYTRMHPDLARKAEKGEKIAAYLEERYANNPQKLAELKNNPKFIELKNANKVLNNKMTGIRFLGPFVIFTTIYRFVGPVFVTPIANWLSEKIQPHKKDA